MLKTKLMIFIIAMSMLFHPVQIQVADASGAAVAAMMAAKKKRQLERKIQECEIKAGNFGVTFEEACPELAQYLQDREERRPFVIAVLVTALTVIILFFIYLFLFI